MLTLQFKKRSDGGAALTLVRADGSRTWQRQEPRHASFFAGHDLAHLAVESELGLRDAFYGLVARGWEFSDFAAPWPRGPVGVEAIWAETIVGLLDLDRAQRARGDALPDAQATDAAPLDAEAVNGIIASKFAERGAPPPRALTEDEWQRCRARRDALLAAWDAVAIGETYEATFPLTT